MRHYLFVVLLCFPIWVHAQNFAFFTEEDIAHIRSSASTDWGKKIVVSLRQAVSERRCHTLDVPLLEGGHLHDYFCPLHRVRFIMDWERATEHYCPECMKYWSGNKRYDWGWVTVAHYENLEYLRNCMFLHLATEDTIYLYCIRDMLLDYASKYSTYLNHDTDRKVGPWGGKMFGQSLDEAVWASDACRAYVLAKQILDADEVEKIENGYLKPCARLLLQRRGTANWQAWHNSGLAALGVALENDSIIQVAVNDPDCGYHVLVKQYVNSDGWWGEGAPTYHFYALKAMLLTADAVRCRNMDLFDDKLYNMFANPALGVYSDLFFPAHNDGWYGVTLCSEAGLYEIACRRYAEDPFLKSILRNCYSRMERCSAEALLGGVELLSASAGNEWQSVKFDSMGYAILRSDGRTVVLKYGPHGGGHGHPDKLSISIHDGVRELVTDMGTCAYGIPEYTGWYRKTLAHSTVTVDGIDQNTTTGTLKRFTESRNGGRVEAECGDAYQGVDLKRSLDLQKNRLRDVFTVSSTEEHWYDYVLILSCRPETEAESQTQIVLDGGNAYQYIKDVSVVSGNNSIKYRVGNAVLHILLEQGKSVEFITGEAPGIPPGNGVQSNSQNGSKCYPLIVRCKGTAMKVKAEWEFLSPKKEKRNAE